MFWHFAFWKKKNPCVGLSEKKRPMRWGGAGGKARGAAFRSSVHRGMGFAFNGSCIDPLTDRESRVVKRRDWIDPHKKRNGSPQISNFQNVIWQKGVSFGAGGMACYSGETYPGRWPAPPTVRDAADVGRHWGERRRTVPDAGDCRSEKLAIFCRSERLAIFLQKKNCLSHAQRGRARYKTLRPVDTTLTHSLRSSLIQVFDRALPLARALTLSLFDVAYTPPYPQSLTRQRKKAAVGRPPPSFERHKKTFFPRHAHFNASVRSRRQERRLRPF